MTLENERLSHAGTGSVLDYFPGWGGKVITGELSVSAVEHLEGLRTQAGGGMGWGFILVTC